VIGALGVVIRDAEGSVIVASAKWYNHMADALTREFLAARDGRSMDYGEIQELSRSFVSLEFSFVNREGNRAAHVCASMPSELEPDLERIGNFPGCLLEAFGTDCNPAMI
jgi:hypothetical protein